MTQDSPNETTKAKPNKDMAHLRDNVASPELEVAPLVLSMHVRILLAFYGILMPLVYLLTTAPVSSPPSDLSNKFSFLLFGECIWPTLPFLIFTMICMGLVIRNENWASAKPWVRFGIFCGPIIYCWYMAAFGLLVMSTPSFEVVGFLVFIVLCAAVWLSVVHGTIECLTTLPYGKIPTAAKFGAGTILIVFLVATFQAGATRIFLYPFFIVLSYSAPLAFLTYVGVSIRILDLRPPARRFTMAQLMIWVTWLTAFAAAIRVTIELSAAKHAHYFLNG